MQKAISLALIITTLLAATVPAVDIGSDKESTHLGGEEFTDLDSLAASGKHKSWCSFKAASAKIWCKTKAVATINSAQRAINLANCDYSYNLALQVCPQRRLDKHLMKMAQNHKSWCSFKAGAANAWCKSKAVATFDSVKRGNNLLICQNNYNAALATCPNRRLDRFLETNAQKHKSWCTFKAFSAKSWCKTKALSFNAANRNNGFQACDNKYNLDVAQCAQRRLMRDMEKSILAGNAHESWCTFKNRSKWLWCKAAKSINTNAVQRAANLAQCDAAYNQGNAICSNQNLGLDVNTSGN